MYIISLSIDNLTLETGDGKLKKPKTGKIRNLRKSHRGGILLPRKDRRAIDVTCTEHNNMIITVYLECIKDL